MNVDPEKKRLQERRDELAREIRRGHYMCKQCALGALAALDRRIEAIK